MPDHIGAVDEWHADLLQDGVRVLEQAELHLGGMCREHREVDARAVPGGTEGIG
jgi:hypothetical protein